MKQRGGTRGREEEKGRGEGLRGQQARSKGNRRSADE